jgi:hypothetical protein
MKDLGTVLRALILGTYATSAYGPANTRVWVPMPANRGPRPWVRYGRIIVRQES